MEDVIKENEIGYVIHSRPLHRTKGNGARVFVRCVDKDTGRGRTTYVDTPKAARVASVEVDNAQSIELFTAWNLDERLRGMRFEMRPFDRTRDVIHALLDDKEKANREMLAAIAREQGLRSGFFLSRNWSSSRDNRFAFPSFTCPTFAQYDPETHVGIISEHHRSYTLEELLPITLRDVHMTMDIETSWGFRHKGEGVEHVITTTNHDDLPNIIWSRDQAPFRERNGFEIRIFQDEDQLREELTDHLRITDPLSLAGYNLCFFDLMKLRTWTGLQSPIDGSKMHKTGGVGRTSTMYVDGLIILDMLNKNVEEIPFLVDLRLGTMMKYYKLEAEGEQWEKPMNHLELARAMEAHDPRAFVYITNDGIGTELAAEDQRKQFFAPAIAGQFQVEKVGKGRKATIDEVWGVTYFRQNGTMENRHRYGYIPRRNLNVVQRRFFSDPRATEAEQGRGRRVNIQGTAALQKVNGLFKHAAFVYPTLLLRATQDIYREWPRLQELWHYYEEQGNMKGGPVRKYRGLRLLTEFMTMPVTDYLNIARQFTLDPAQPWPRKIGYAERSIGFPKTFSKADDQFREFYGNGVVSLHDLNRRFVEQVRLWRANFSDDAVINYDKLFLIMDPEAAYRLAEEKLGIILTQGAAVSDQDRAILYSHEHDALYCMGTNLRAGGVCDWEYEAIQEVIKGSLAYLSAEEELNAHVVRALIEEEIAKIQDMPDTKFMIPVRRKATRDNKTEEMEEVRMVLEGIVKEDDDSFVGYKGLDSLEKFAFLDDPRPVNAGAYVARFRERYKDILDVLMAEHQKSLFE